MPKPSADDIERTTTHVLARIDQLVMSKQAVVDRSGLSFKTVDRLIEQRVLPTYRDKRKQLARGLYWPDDAIERLLDGADPTTLPDVDQAAGDGAPPWDELLAGQRTLAEQQEEVSRRLARLAELLERGE